MTDKIKTNRKRWDEMTKEEKKRLIFEEESYFNVKGRKKLTDALGSILWDAYRVSPRTTTIHGKKYKKIYGTQLQPSDEQNRTGKKTAAKVDWYQYGVTRADAKSGTTMINPSSLSQYDRKATKRKLMM